MGAWSVDGPAGGDQVVDADEGGDVRFGLAIHDPEHTIDQIVLHYNAEAAVDVPEAETMVRCSNKSAALN